MRKILAIAFLGFLIVTAIHSILLIAENRIQLAGDIAETKERILDLAQRQTALEPLRVKRDTLASTAAKAEFSIAAANKGSASTSMQQLVRERSEATQQKLISAMETPSGKTDREVLLLVRTRGLEADIIRFMDHLENRDPSLSIVEFTISSRDAQTSIVRELEFSGVLRTTWTPEKQTQR